MRAIRRQTTLAAPCTVSGRGYWTGQPNALTFRPAPAHTGVRFVRADLEGRPSVCATTDSLVSMPLRTRLAQGRAEVDMVEHVMAALYGLQIDNVLVDCTAAEMPAMDGSSLAFTLALQSAGTQQLTDARGQLRITETIRLGDDQQWIEARPLSDGELSEYEYRMDFGIESPIAASTARLALTPDDFVNQLAFARTFITLDNARWLQTRGLARHVTEQDLLVVGQHGPINNKLRCEDEYARHKLLDLIGDLALVGMDVVGRIVACRGGHQLNGKLAVELRRIAAQREEKPNLNSERRAA